MDFDKFVKLMELTRSDNDHECLLAIRKANEHLKNANKGWKQFLDQKFIETIKYVDVIRYVEVEKVEKEENTIAFRINYLLDHESSLQPSAQEFIRSIYKTFIERESVSEKQAMAIDKFYKNMRRRRF